MSDTYADIQLEEQEQKFGGYYINALEDYTSTKELDSLEGLLILERMAEETTSTSHAADLRYLHRLIMSLDSSPLPF